MDLFLFGILLFLLVNVVVVITMLRRINLHNDSVLAWEQMQQATAQPELAQPQPQPVYASAYMAEAA